jgi:GT2 family glycosyltransferase
MSERNTSSADLSVIIVTYNSAASVADCLRSVLAYVPGAEAIVVDNGSTDGTVELAARNPCVRVITGHGNVGFGAGVNLGAHAASGGLLLVLNPDASLVAVDHGELQILRRDLVTGLVGCRVRDPQGERHFKSVAWGWHAELYWALAQYFLAPREVSLRRPRLLDWRRRHWIAGAAFVARRSEFLEVGGFDDRFFLYFEDFDLSRIYRARGWPIRSTDAFTVAHIGQSSSPREEHTMTAYALLGLIEYVHKWEGAGAARDVASQCLRLLKAVEIVGRACEHIPLLGPRAAKKRKSAYAVRASLLAAATESPVPGAYPAASDALRSARRSRTA